MTRAAVPESIAEVTQSMAEHTSKRVSTVYAEALYEAGAGANALPAVRADVESLQKLLQEYPEYERLLADPKMDIEGRDGIIRRAFDGRIYGMTLNFLLVLNRRWRLGSLGPILEEYVRLDNRRRLGRRDVEVVSAVALDAGMLEQVKQAVSAWGGFEAILHLKQDESLLGGLMIRVGDRQIDATVKGQLERLRGHLKKEFEARGGAAAPQAAG
jgi:F-type H+-transporting ATPase subunit delta